MIIILIGYMASGKSTIGKSLAKNLNYPFLDLDDYIELKENNSISSIFKSNGEIYFRKAETVYLKELLDTKNNLVLSLGGGTPCYNNNMDLILSTKKVISIYLKASIPTLVARLKQEKNKRPLVSHIETEDLLTEFVAKHLFERAPYYSLANFTVATDNKPVNTIIADLVLKLF